MKPYSKNFKSKHKCTAHSSDDCCMCRANYEKDYKKLSRMAKSEASTIKANGRQLMKQETRKEISQMENQDV